MPLTQGAKVFLGVGTALGAYYYLRKPKAATHAGDDVYRARGGPIDSRRNWPDAEFYERRFETKGQPAVLEKPSAGQRLGRVAQVVGTHTIAAATDAARATGEVATVLAEHTIEAVKDVGTMAKETGEALVAENVPMQTTVRRTPPVTVPVREVTAQKPQTVTVTVPAGPAASTRDVTPSPTDIQPPTGAYGTEDRYAQIQEHGSHVERALHKMETQDRLPEGRGQFQPQAKEGQAVDQEAYPVHTRPSWYAPRGGKATEEGPEPLYVETRRGMRYAVYPVDEPSTGLGQRYSPEQQGQGYGQGTAMQGMKDTASSAAQAVGSTASGLAGTAVSAGRHATAAVSDAAQAAGEVGTIAAAHAKGAAKDVLTAARETAEALMGEKQPGLGGQGVTVTRVPDLVTDSSSSNRQQTPQPYQQQVQPGQPSQGPETSTYGRDVSIKAVRPDATMAEGRLRQMREDAKAQARDILAQGRRDRAELPADFRYWPTPPAPSSSGDQTIQPSSPAQDLSSPTTGPGQSPSLGDRLSAAGTVLSEHAKAAAQDVKQAASETSTVMGTHAEMAKRDVRGFGDEMQSGKAAAGAAQPRVTPPLAEGTSQAKAQPVAREWAAAQMRQAQVPEQIRTAGKSERMS